MKNLQELTGYPSIDKPWLKYYSEEAIKNLLYFMIGSKSYNNLSKSNKNI